jgi:hypothetical protein
VLKSIKIVLKSIKIVIKIHNFQPVWTLGGDVASAVCSLVLERANRDASGAVVAAWVAVAGWLWDHSIGEIKAVRMVVVRTWQWQYWLSYGSLIDFFFFFFAPLCWSVRTGTPRGRWWPRGWQWLGGCGTIR